MARKNRGAQYVNAYNSRPYPVMVDSVGHLMDGSSSVSYTHLTLPTNREV